jgi:capsular polysaccharide export protein
MYSRKVLLGLGKIRDGYTSFRDMARRRTLSVYLGERHRGSLVQAANHGGSVLIVANFGPGDEIRFASLYRQMRSICSNQEVTFTCDPRLHALFSRSYPDLVFLPVARARALSVKMDSQRYNLLPGADLHAYFDNAGWAAATAADNVVIVTDALGDVIEDRTSFIGAPYLRADSERIRSIRQRLLRMSEAPLVGLTWRSSLRSHARNEHYLKVDEIAQFATVPGVQFVNLQSDECDDELALLNKIFPKQIINLSDIDQYNDLDGAAAVMSSLDLVIAPATTPFELAAGLGVETWLLSNSSELHWRKCPGTDVDVWHNCLKHIEGERLGDKKSLVDAAVMRLTAWSAATAKRAVG